MIKKINWLQSYAVLGFLTYSLAGTAADINQVDTTAQEQIRQQERLNQLRQQQEIKPDARGAGESLKTTVPVTTDVIPENETPCFTINQIELVGDGAKHFKFALNAVLDASNTSTTKPILGRCLGAVGINAIMARVQNAIIAKGYVTTRVLAAPQDLKNGVLQLTVVPGRINAVRFTPDSSKRANAWNAVPMSKGDILNLRDIEQSLENFKRVPTAEADIQIEPAAVDPTLKQSASEPGLSDVMIHYQQRPVPFRVSLILMTVALIVPVNIKQERPYQATTY